MTSDERQALGALVGAVRVHYGKRLHDVLVFGSRARGEGRSDSDVDVAVVLRDGNWDYWDEKLHLVDLSWKALWDAELIVEPWLVTKAVWDDPDLHRNPHFVRDVIKDARPVSEAI